jgi:FlaG/FlaF family flagellin (archaellin)
MHYLKRLTRKNGENAVSPVVGVMLMLVVTIIIAAVVSGFAGGLVNGQQKSPTLSMDVKVSNSGSYIGSGFSATVNSVSEPISTGQIKIVTTWTTTMKNSTSADVKASSVLNSVANGAMFSSGNTSVANIQNIWFNPGVSTSTNTNGETVPFGVGQGINSSALDPFDYSAGYFGQYTLKQGVGLFAYPYGSASESGSYGGSGQADTTAGYNGLTPYVYYSGTPSGFVDPAIAVLGGGWEQLRAGDIVHVKMIYIPTGATIFSKDVAVTEG